MMSYTYLASPYSHDDPRIKQQRYGLALRASVALMRRNIFVFSSIVHCHNMATNYGLPGNYIFWKTYNRTMLTACENVLVLCIDGVGTSKGVAAELLVASEFNKFHQYIEVGRGKVAVKFIGLEKAQSKWDAP